MGSRLFSFLLATALVVEDALLDNPGLPLILTPLIETNQTERARNQAEVQFSGFGTAKTYSGFLTVDKQHASNMFFWYLPAQNGDATAPTILWMQGGPGQTSLVGLFAESGPFSVKSKHGLLKRKYPWTLAHSLIYLDSPVGGGFSFTADGGGYSRNSTAIAEDVCEALAQLFKMFPALSQSDFYVAAEGFAAKAAVAVAHQVLKSPQLGVPLRGLAIGNGFCDPINQLGYGDYLYQIGLIDWNGLQDFAALEKSIADSIKNGKWQDAYASFDAMVKGRSHPATLFKNLTGFDYTSDFLLPENDDSQLDYIAQYLQRDDVRAALHVGNATLNAGAEVEAALTEDFMQSVAPLIPELLGSYRLLFYSGQLDVLYPYAPLAGFLRSLDFDSAAEFRGAGREMWLVNGALAGYSKQAGNLTEVLVRDAGYMAIRSQPEWLFDLIMRFTSGKAFGFKRRRPA